jgi:hypothetical protein
MSDKLSKETELPRIKVLASHKELIKEIKLDYGYSSIGAFIRGLLIAAIKAHKNGTLAELLNKPRK